MKVVKQYESCYGMLFLKHTTLRPHISVTHIVGMMALEVSLSFLPLYSPPTCQG